MEKFASLIKISGCILGLLSVMHSGNVIINEIINKDTNNSDVYSYAKNFNFNINLKESMEVQSSTNVGNILNFNRMTNSYLNFFDLSCNINLNNKENDGIRESANGNKNAFKFVLVHEVTHCLSVRNNNFNNVLDVRNNDVILEVLKNHSSVNDLTLINVFKDEHISDINSLLYFFKSNNEVESKKLLNDIIAFREKRYNINRTYGNTADDVYNDLSNILLINNHNTLESLKILKDNFNNIYNYINKNSNENNYNLAIKISSVGVSNFFAKNKIDMNKLKMVNNEYFNNYLKRSLINSINGNYLNIFASLLSANDIDINKLYSITSIGNVNLNFNDEYIKFKNFISLLPEDFELDNKDQYDFLKCLQVYLKEEGEIKNKLNNYDLKNYTYKNVLINSDMEFINIMPNLNINNKKVNEFDKLKMNVLVK